MEPAARVDRPSLAERGRCSGGWACGARRWRARRSRRRSIIRWPRRSPRWRRPARPAIRLSTESWHELGMAGRSRDRGSWRACCPFPACLLAVLAVLFTKGAVAAGDRADADPGICDASPGGAGEVDGIAAAFLGSLAWTSAWCVRRADRCPPLGLADANQARADLRSGRGARRPRSSSGAWPAGCVATDATVKHRIAGDSGSSPSFMSRSGPGGRGSPRSRSSLFAGARRADGRSRCRWRFRAGRQRWESRC